jgi:hypothetical protein
VKSAQQQLESAQRRLANLLGRANPLFPKDYAAKVASAQTDVEYWTVQAATEQQAAVNLFAPVPVQPVSNVAPQVVYYNAPNLPDAASSTRNTVMAVGAIVAIVAAVAYLRVQG